ncbi:MAG TPA: FecR domain-containing protein [Polyangia bacterium]|nr:FecR domain-containing protein [Polyangia bacterium]
MTPAEDQALVEALSEAARRVAAVDGDGQPPPGAWHRLEARRQARPRRWMRLWAAAATLGALAIVGVGWRVWRAGATGALTYAVAGGTIEESGYVRGGAHDSARLDFSDGTRVNLGPGAKLSVAATGAHGARLRLQDGTAHFEVVHRPHAAWTVEAGPYSIEVTGTVFDVHWSGGDEIAEVRLRAGSVRVSGPLLAERATLRPGQSLIARLAAHEVRIESEAARRPSDEGRPPGDTPPAVASPPAAPAPPVGPVLADPGSERAAVDQPAGEQAARERAATGGPTRAKKRGARRLASATPAPPPEAWTPAGWTARVAAGDTKAILSEAEAHGLDAVLDQADSPALTALADAARYDGRPGLAARVLAVQRRRFPGTPAAANAAFFLGRLADDGGAPVEALDWYRRYLAEQPRGPYASEALGRAMLGVARVSGQASARKLAEEYLARFPNGTYLLHARQILANP